MKKLLIILSMLIGLVRPSSASALSDAAAALQPGQWTTITTNNINLTLTHTGGASGFIFGYTESIKWDPVTKKLFYVGMDHNQTLPLHIQRFVSYDDASNTWSILPPAGFMFTGSTPWHGYDHMAIDSVHRKFYTRNVFDGRVVHGYNLDNGTWIDLPPNNVLQYQGCCGGLDYFPELGGIVWAQGTDTSSGNTSYMGVFLFSDTTQAWTRLGTASTYAAGPYNNFAEYNPVHKVVVFGGGNDSRKLYKLSSDGTITALNDAPVDIGVQRSLFTVDPVSGDYLVFSNTNTSFWVYKVQTDTWIQQPGIPPIFQPPVNVTPVHGLVATPISTYGVNLFVDCQTDDCVVRLYKHVTGGTPPPSDTTSPTTPTSLTTSVISSSQVNLSWTPSTDNVGVVGYKVFRNGSEVGTTTQTSYQNTGLTASITYSFTVSAYDATGNNSPQSASVTATTQAAPPPPSGSSDYATRCAAPGVVRCYGFDDQTDFSQYYESPSGTTAIRGAIDTTAKASGAGSLKFTIPSQSGSDVSGSFSMNFTAGSLNCGSRPAYCSTQAYPTQFGPGQEFYVQWRQRFSPEFLSNNWLPGNTTWKQAIIGEGDRMSTPAFSCTQLEVTTTGGVNRAFPTMYHSCGEKVNSQNPSGYYQPLDQIRPGGDFYMENAMPTPFCLYSKTRVGNNTGCFLYAPNEWMTFQVHVKIGTWYLNNNVFHRDSQIQLWAAREGQPSQLVIDTGLYASGQSPDPGTFTPNPNGGFDLANTSANAKYGKVWLLPYITAKDATQALPVSYVWYDDLIVSTQKIADPSVTSGPPDTTPPAAPVSLKIVN